MQTNDQAAVCDRLMGKFLTDPTSLIHSNQLEWQQQKGSPRFNYPIDYSVAITSLDREAGLIEFLAKWAPNAYCHFHRHLGRTMSRVLQGEHHIVETTETQTLHKTRRPGFQGLSPAGDLHMEYGGADGSTVLFLCEAVDGKVFDVVARDGTLIATATIDDFVSGRLR
jgi:hypothetical protein